MTRRLLVERLEEAVEDLQAIDLPMVIVGGAVMPFYVNAEAATVLRETVDVDVMVEAATHAEFAALEERLRAAGFRQHLHEPGPRCRWYKDDRRYDIVDVRTDHPRDRWARATGPGIDHRRLPSGRSIPVLAPGRFMAAKVAALLDRGGPRWYESADFEDLVLLLESHPDLPTWLAGSPVDAVRAVSTWAEAALRRPGIREEVEATVTRGPELERRAEVVLARLSWLASGSGKGVT